MRSDKFELQIVPEWDRIDETRDMVLKYLENNNIQFEKAYSVGMIVSELLENAIKYGKATAQSPVTLEIDIDNRELTVEMKNTILESNRYNLHKLDRTLQWFHSFQSPFEAYMEKLKEISSRDIRDRESGLGLVRIAYEGQGNIDFYLDENDMLCVSVVVSL